MSGYITFIHLQYMDNRDKANMKRKLLAKDATDDFLFRIANKYQYIYIYIQIFSFFLLLQVKFPLHITKVEKELSGKNEYKDTELLRDNPCSLVSEFTPWGQVYWTIHVCACTHTHIYSRRVAYMMSPDLYDSCNTNRACGSTFKMKSHFWG